MWAVRGILCLLVLFPDRNLLVYCGGPLHGRPWPWPWPQFYRCSGEGNTLSGCRSPYLAGQGEVYLRLDHDCDCGGTFYNWTLTSPDGVRQQIGTCYGCKSWTWCSTTINNDAFSVKDSNSLVIRNMTQQYSGWEVRAEAYNDEGRLVESQHCLLNVSFVKMLDTSVVLYDLQQQSRQLAECRTATQFKEGDQLKWMLRSTYRVSAIQPEYTLATCTYRTRPSQPEAADYREGSLAKQGAPGSGANGENDDFTCDNTVYRDGKSVSGDLGVRSSAVWNPYGPSSLRLSLNASRRFVSDMQGSLICQYTSDGFTSFDSRPMKLYRTSSPATLDNCSVNVQKQSAILSCDVSNVYSSDRNFTFSVVAKFKYSSQYDDHYTQGTSSDFTLFTGSYADGLTAYTNSVGALVYRGRLEYSWSLGRCVGAYHQIRVLVWPGPDSAHPTGYYKTYDITQIVIVGHPEWVPDMEGGKDSIALQDDGPASVFCNYYTFTTSWNEDPTDKEPIGGLPVTRTWKWGYTTSGPHTTEKYRHSGWSAELVAANTLFLCAVLLLIAMFVYVVYMLHRRRKEGRLGCKFLREDAVHNCGLVREVVVRKGCHVCKVVVRKCRSVCESPLHRAAGGGGPVAQAEHVEEEEGQQTLL